MYLCRGEEVSMTLALTLSQTPGKASRLQLHRSSLINEKIEIKKAKYTDAKTIETFKTFL